MSTHILAVTLCGALASVSVASSKKARKAEHVPFASRARQVHEVPMLFFVFVLVLLSRHKSIGGRLLLLPQAAQDGLALCHLSRHDTSRGVPSQGGHWSKVCACVHVFVLVSPSHHKTSRLWTLAQDIILEWEQRKKRRFGGGAPCESRKTVFCVPCPVASDSCHDQASA